MEAFRNRAASFCAGVHVTSGKTNGPRERQPQIYESVNTGDGTPPAPKIGVSSIWRNWPPGATLQSAANGKKVANGAWISERERT